MSQILCIDSTNRTSTSSSTSNFTVQLNIANRVKKVIFRNINFKFSWYPITQLDTLTITESVSGPTVVNMDFPTAWTGTAIATMLQTQINASGVTNTYSVTYSNVTSKYTISRTGAEDFQLSFDQTQTLWKVLGFPSTGITFNVSSITGNVGYAFGFDYVIIRSNNLLEGANQIVTGFQGTDSSGKIRQAQNVFLTIPVNVEYGGSIQYFNDQIEREICYMPAEGRTNKWLNEVDIKITNPYTDEIIDLNEGSVQIELLLITENQ